MATAPMKKMNKSQKKKLQRLAARRRQFDEFCTKIPGFSNANRKKPGAVK